MANTKISALTANTNPNWWEELVYACNNANGKMTLNTMKTFIQPDMSQYATKAEVQWKQDELISWTNIKTINGNSILWSWNMVISWWWWGGWQVVYDCIVAADWTWDYTTLSAALSAWNNRIFIRDWVYNETTQITITTPTIYIQWESADWVVINIEKSSTETTYLWYIVFDGSWYNDDLIWEINNVTFNLIIGKWNQSYYIVYAWTDAMNKNVAINNCYMNVLTKVSWANISISYMDGWANLWKNILSCNGCIFVADAHSSVSASSVWCNFATWTSETSSGININNNCQFIIKTLWLSVMRARWHNDNCVFWVYWDESSEIASLNITWINTWCFFNYTWYCHITIWWRMTWCSVNNYWYGSLIDASLRTAFKTALWQTWAKRLKDWWVHQYDEWDFCINWGLVYRCTSSHSVSVWTTFEDDLPNWKEYLWDVNISSAAKISNCELHFPWDIIVWNDADIYPSIWNNDWDWCIWNNMIMLGNNSNVLLCWRNILNWNEIRSNTYTHTYDVYAMDNCIINNNFFNFWAAWTVKVIWNNSMIIWNVLNTYSWTATHSVYTSSNNIDDNNIVSNRIFSDWN